MIAKKARKIMESDETSRRDCFRVGRDMWTEGVRGGGWFGSLVVAARCYNLTSKPRQCIFSRKRRRSKSTWKRTRRRRLRYDASGTDAAQDIIQIPWGLLALESS